MYLMQFPSYCAFAICIIRILSFLCTVSIKKSLWQNYKKVHLRLYWLTLRSDIHIYVTYISLLSTLVFLYSTQRKKLQKERQMLFHTRKWYSSGAKARFMINSIEYRKVKCHQSVGISGLVYFSFIIIWLFYFICSCSNNNRSSY